MNRSTRIVKVGIALAHLAEVIADVLQEAHEQGYGPLTVDEIRVRGAFPATPRINQVVRGVLNRMRQEGLVDRADNADGYQEWWLVDE